MALLSLQTITAAGITPTYGAATSGGDKVALAAGNVFLHVKNGGGSTVTVTITTQSSTYKGLTVPDRTVTVAASGEKMSARSTPAFTRTSTSRRRSATRP
jgi:hypothetical protein